VEVVETHKFTVQYLVLSHSLRCLPSHYFFDDCVDIIWIRIRI